MNRGVANRLRHLQIGRVGADIRFGWRSVFSARTQERFYFVSRIESLMCWAFSFFYGMFYVRRMLLDAVGYIRNLFGRSVDAGIDFPFYLFGLFLDAVVHGCKF